MAKVKTITSPFDRSASAAGSVLLTGALMVATSNSATISDGIDYKMNVAPIVLPAIEAPVSEQELDEIMARWKNDWRTEAVTVVNKFIGDLLKKSRTPDPEAAAIMEENLWDLV